MREHKYKAWDRVEKKMYEGIMPFVKDGIFKDRTGFVAHRAGNDLLNIENLNVDWLEYTGLKDKSGVEISEGDIVEFEGKAYEIYWDAYRWHMCNKRGVDWDNGEEYGDWSDYINFKHVKVIGNIYPNPELIK